MVVESVPQNIGALGAVVFEKWVKQCNANTFVQAKRIFTETTTGTITETQIIFMTLFYSFLKNHSTFSK